MTEDPIATQLCAVIDAGETALERLTAALQAAEFASLMIASASGMSLEAAVVRPLVEIAQRQGVAVLIADDARLARTVRADGVHLGINGDLRSAYKEARSIMGLDGIVGADGGISRHDAMTVAEDGADYIAFGAPAHLKDRDKAKERRDELIAWWAEIFQAPCIALDVETAAEAEALSKARADFVAIKLPPAASPSATREFVATIAAAIAAPAAAD